MTDQAKPAVVYPAEIGRVIIERLNGAFIKARQHDRHAGSYEIIATFEGVDHLIRVTPYEGEKRVEAGPVPEVAVAGDSPLLTLRAILTGGLLPSDAFDWDTAQQGDAFWSNVEHALDETHTLPPEARAIIEEWVRVLEAEQDKDLPTAEDVRGILKPEPKPKPPVWLPDAKVGDRFTRADGEVVKYESFWPDRAPYPHRIGSENYTNDGRWSEHGLLPEYDLIAPYTEDNRPSGTCVGAGPAQFGPHTDEAWLREHGGKSASDDLEALLIQYLGASTDGAKAVADAFRRAARDAAGSR